MLSAVGVTIHCNAQSDGWMRVVSPLRQWVVVFLLAAHVTIKTDAQQSVCSSSILVPRDKFGRVDRVQLAVEGVTVEIWGLNRAEKYEAILRIDSETVATATFSPTVSDAVFKFPVPFPSYCGAVLFELLITVSGVLHAASRADTEFEPCSCETLATYSKVASLAACRWDDALWGRFASELIDSRAATKTSTVVYKCATRGCASTSDLLGLTAAFLLAGDGGWGFRADFLVNEASREGLLQWFEATVKLHRVDVRILRNVVSRDCRRAISFDEIDAAFREIADDFGGSLALGSAVQLELECEVGHPALIFVALRRGVNTQDASLRIPASSNGAVHLVAGAVGALFPLLFTPKTHFVDSADNAVHSRERVNGESEKREDGPPSGPSTRHPACVVLEDEDPGWSGAGLAVVWEFVRSRIASQHIDNIDLDGSENDSEESSALLMARSEKIWRAAYDVLGDAVREFPRSLIDRDIGTDDIQAATAADGWTLPRAVRWTGPLLWGVKKLCGEVVVSSSNPELIMLLGGEDSTAWVLHAGVLYPACRYIHSSMFANRTNAGGEENAKIRVEKWGSPLGFWDFGEDGMAEKGVLERAGLHEGERETHALVWEDVEKGWIVDPTLIGSGLKVLRMTELLLPSETIAHARTLVRTAAEVHVGGVDQTLVASIDGLVGHGDVIKSVHVWGGGTDPSPVLAQLPPNWEVQLLRGLDDLGLAVTWPLDGGACVQSQERPICEIMFELALGVILGARVELSLRGVVNGIEVFRKMVYKPPNAGPNECYSFEGVPMKRTDEGACMICQTLSPTPLDEGNHRVKLELIGPWPRVLRKEFSFNVVESEERQTEPHFLSLVAVFKDEDRYLREWIEFHICAGVDHFYLFNHDSSYDLHLELLQPYIDLGLVDLEQARPSTTDERGRLMYSGQLETYTYAVRKHAHDTVWIACLDLDEFLHASGPVVVFNRHGTRRMEQNPTLRDALEGGGYGRFGGVVAHWLHFGSGGLVAPAPGLTFENFVWRDDVVGEHFKVIARAKRVRYCNNHNHDYEQGFFAVDEAYHRIGNNQSVNHRRPAKTFRLNHYRLKSLEEIAGRIRRDLTPHSFARERHDWDDFTSTSTTPPRTRLTQYLHQPRLNVLRDASTAARFSACVRTGLARTGLPLWVALVDFGVGLQTIQTQDAALEGGGVVVPLVVRSGGRERVPIGVWVDGNLVASVDAAFDEQAHDAGSVDVRVQVPPLPAGDYQLSAAVLSPGDLEVELQVKEWVRELIPAEFLELWQETQPPRPEMPPGAVSVRLRVLDSGWLEDRDALPSKQLWPSPGHLAGALAISTDSER